MDNKENKYLATLDESLKYAREIALEHFKNFDFSIQTPKIKQFLLNEIESHIRNNEYQVAILLPQFNYIDEQEKIKDIVYKIAGKIELSQLLNIADYESILFIDNKFRINGAFDGELRDCQCHTIKKCLKYPLYLRHFKIIDNITEDFEMKADLSFENCEFLGKIKLYKNEIPIKYTIEMKNCTFYKEFIMSNKNFSKGVYFNNATFKGYADFHESKFDTTACFYGVTFEELPNFSQTIFNGNLNLVNSNLNFDFDECNNVVDIEKKRRDNENDKHCDKDKVANDFRDSFRGFKSALIENNNLLDASNYHKIELYFKEIELDSKKPKIFSKEWIDLWQLKLYRLTSNHHTDLLRIFSCLVILIGCFATIMFVDKNLNSLLDIRIIKGFFGIFLIVYLIYRYEQITIFDFLALLSCIPCIWLLSSNPKFIFGVAGLFNSECEKKFVLNLIISIYTILSILLIFSLQKTARKNSIIPS